MHDFQNLKAWQKAMDLAVGVYEVTNLLRSKKWEAKLIVWVLLDRTRQRLEEMGQSGQRPLMLWEDSRLEKPEGWFLEGLCSVSSSKGKQLTKIKRGYYNPPANRICVPGFFTERRCSCLVWRAFQQCVR